MNLPPALHSNSKEHDSWEHTLHESLHMTHKSFTFVATFSQMACTHTFISNTNFEIQFQTQSTDCQCELFLVHSPLLKESYSVFCPPLICLKSVSPFIYIIIAH